MMKAANLAAAFEEIIGWPYASPGTNDQNGIDCSGAFVRAYKKHGLAIAHGSNTIFRKHCGSTGPINGDGSNLRVGMAVFKLREWKDDQRGHRDYGTMPGDIYHVGCVTSVNPLRIIHATPPASKADTTPGKWAYWGMLKEVDYSEINVDGPDGHSASPAVPPSMPSLIPAEPGPGQAEVITERDNLNLRRTPSDANKENILNSMPRGTIVGVLERDGAWSKVRYTDKHGMSHVGYAWTDYLKFGGR